jgi:nucleotide-binding universal stress UspA family protein
MERTKRLLIAVDDSPASRRALRYVSELLRGTQGFAVVLLHMLGPVPTHLKESRGAETPREEEKVEAGLIKGHNQFLKKSAEEARPLLEQAKAMLMSAQVPAEAIEGYCPELTHGEDFVRDILRAARQRDCATIVIGRESWTGLKEFFVDHTADNLIQKGEGFAFWVVE